jgi:hypothetical protein
MKNNIFEKTLLLLLVFSTSNIFSQTVTMNITNVNGSAINSSTPITLNTNSIGYVSLETQVTLPNTPSDSYPGTIKIYYQRNSTYPLNVANGGDGGGLLFLGSTTAYRYFNITLNSSQFDPTGGYIYAEYQTYSGIRYKSPNKSVVVSTTTGGTGGSSGTSCNLHEHVPYGGVPLLPILPISGITSWVYSTGNYDIPFLGISNIVTEGTAIRQKQILGNSNHYSCEFNIYVYRPFSNIANNYTYENNITENQYITYGSTPQTITGTQASISYSSGGRNSTTTGTVRTTIPLNSYQWQMRIVKPLPFWNDYRNYIITYGWKDILNANQQNYTPTGTATQAIEYRRLVIDTSINTNPKSAIASNIVGVYPTNNSNISNTIFCDQDIQRGQSVSQINGSPTTLNNDSFQWQKRNTTYTNNSVWENIPNATNKDYLPNSTRVSQNTEYRRIAISNDLVYYPSNIILKRYINTRGRLADNNSDKEKFFISDNEEISIYPNPATSSLHISNLKDYKNVTLYINDLTARALYTETKTSFDSNDFPIDISNLPKGVYFLNIETNAKKTSIKFIKE